MVKSFLLRQTEKSKVSVLILILFLKNRIKLVSSRFNSLEVSPTQLKMTRKTVTKCYGATRSRLSLIRSKLLLL